MLPADRHRGLRVLRIARQDDSDRDLPVVGSVRGIEGAAPRVEAHLAAESAAKVGFESLGVAGPGHAPHSIIPAMPATPATHLAISPRLVGEPLELGAGTARAALTLLPEMAADDRGLVHGGFAFGLADYAAMLAVNHPLVVLASSSVKFLAPTRVGERLVAEARVVEETGRRRRVQVEVRRGEEAVASGEFLAVVPDRHVLDPKETA
jgi:uncharacterized protein (TIGR00369 family)